MEKSTPWMRIKPAAEAMLVHGGKILAVGSNAEISAYHVREQVDLKHQPVLPGLSTHTATFPRWWMTAES